MSRRSGVLYLGDYDPEADEQDEDEQVSYTVVHGPGFPGAAGGPPLSQSQSSTMD